MSPLIRRRAGPGCPAPHPRRTLALAGQHPVERGGCVHRWNRIPETVSAVMDGADVNLPARWPAAGKVQELKAGHFFTIRPCWVRLSPTMNPPCGSVPWLLPPRGVRGRDSPPTQAFPPPWRASPDALLNRYFLKEAGEQCGPADLRLGDRHVMITTGYEAGLIRQLSRRPYVEP